MAATKAPKHASQLQKPNITIGLFRDDGLAISNTTPRDTENIKKEICRISNHNGVRITIEAKKQTINFLDVTFKPNKNTYQPFTKPYTTLQCVHCESNHPPTTTKNIQPASTKDCHPSHPTKHPSTKPLLHTKKHSKNADTGTLYTTNHPQLTNETTDNGTTYSGTTPLQQKRQHQYRTQIPCHCRQALPERLQT